MIRSKKSTVVLLVCQKPVTSVKEEEFRLRFEGLCSVRHPILMRKSKECLSAALPEDLNDVLLLLSLDFHLSLLFLRHRERVFREHERCISPLVHWSWFI